MFTDTADQAPLQTGTETNPARWIVPLVALLLVALVAAVATWGIVVLGLLMVAVTPVMFVILVLISVGG